MKDRQNQSSRWIDRHGVLLAGYLRRSSWWIAAVILASAVFHIYWARTMVILGIVVVGYALAFAMEAGLLTRRKPKT
jgi:hypothetical protein